MAKNKDRWVPLQLATSFKPLTQDQIEALAREMNVSPEEAGRIMVEQHKGTEMYINDIYQVQVKKLGDDGSVHLNIRRRDGRPIFRDWRHFQRIKDELIGKDCEAVELYPADDRKVDEGNKYHLWGVRDPTFRFPLGFQYKSVLPPSSVEGAGFKQRA